MQGLAAEAAAAASREQQNVMVHIEGDFAAAERAGLWTEFRTQRIAVGTIALADLEKVAAVAGVKAIHTNARVWPPGRSRPAGAPSDAGRGHPHAPDPPSTATGDATATHAEAVPPLPSGVTGKGAVVGIADTGIDIYHPAFIQPGSNPPRTRIVSLWDESLRQTIECTSDAAGSVVLYWQSVSGRPEEKTASLTLPLSASTVRQALESFVQIDPGDIQVTGGPLPSSPVQIDFSGIYDTANIDQAQLGVIRAVPSFTRGAVRVRRGRLITRAEIDTALQAQPRGKFVSQDFDGVGHGTLVAGIAAGVGAVAKACCKRDQPLGVAPGADIVACRVISRSGVLRAAQHIFTQPWLAPGEFAKPTVLSVSLVRMDSSGDGTDPLSLALDDMIHDKPGRSVVAAAGNEGGFYHPPQPGQPRQQYDGGHHTTNIAPANGPTVIRYAVQPQDTQTNHLHLWYEGPGQLSVNLTAPPNAPGGNGNTGPTLTSPLKPDASAKDYGSARLGGAKGHTVRYLYRPAEPPSGKRHLDLQLDPPPGGPITPGTWTITLRETTGNATRFDLWCVTFGDAKDPSGRFLRTDQNQSRTITAPGTARQAITVGSYDTRDDRLAPDSSHGPTTDLRLKPELCAPGVEITSARNRGIDTTLPLYRKESGTSLAAPYVAGVVALMFEVDATLDQGALLTHLTGACSPPVPPVPPTQLDSGWGYGRINPEKAVDAVRHAVAARSALAATHPIDEPLVLPTAAYPAARVPFATRMGQVRARLENTPAGRHLASLVAVHQEEVHRLVVRDRRVTVAWHRMHGPLLVRLLLFSELDPDLPVPRTLGGRSVAEGLARLLDALHHAGSPALREGIATHRAFVLALPGARLSELDVSVGGGQ
ncbi:S8 family serine peptidase [Streptomyces diastatochromogenes]|uniref:S8 family serine peptidase n=1 Tax=Streptomyces diastatochromogenes TaxID=42236 RepID=UPI003662F4AC